MGAKDPLASRRRFIQSFPKEIVLLLAATLCPKVCTIIVSEFSPLCKAHSGILWEQGNPAYSRCRNKGMKMRSRFWNTCLNRENGGAMYAVPAVWVPSGDMALLWQSMVSVCSRRV